MCIYMFCLPRLAVEISTSVYIHVLFATVGCGGVLNAETEGQLVSPNYPEDYPRSSNCSWLIMADHESEYTDLQFDVPSIDGTEFMVS